MDGDNLSSFDLNQSNACVSSLLKAFESIFVHLDEFPTHIVTDGGLGKEEPFYQI